MNGPAKPPFRRAARPNACSWRNAAAPVVARAPAAAAPAGKDQYTTERGQGQPGRYRVHQSESMVYHLSDSRNYGQTKQGALYVREGSRRRRLPSAEERGAHRDLIFRASVSLLLEHDLFENRYPLFGIML